MLYYINEQIKYIHNYYYYQLIILENLKLIFRIMRYKDLDKVYRRQLHKAWMDGITAKDAFLKVFDGPNPHCALSTVQKKFNWFNRASEDDVEAYLNPIGRKGNAGRKKRYEEDPFDNELINIVEEIAPNKLKRIQQELMARLVVEFDNIPDTATIWRHLKNKRKVRRRLNRKHASKSFEKQIEYLKQISCFDSSRIIDMDGIHFNPKDYAEKFGWTDVGEEPYALQLIIRSNVYSVHAALSKHGFLAWEIFETNVDAHSVARFIRNKLAPLFRDDYILILDNARNQTTLEVRITMNTHLNGQYIYNAPYSPELKPIERAFSMIRRWIRENEFDDTKSDIELINDAFNLYSVLGDKGHCCNNLFNLYDRNHDEYMKEQAIENNV